MAKLALVRHGQSEWNLEDRFTGWWDVNLTPAGEAEARHSGQLLKATGIEFNRCYASVQKRAIRTLDLALDQMDRAWLPVIKDYRLNERHYGGLTGLNKKETAAKHGDAQVMIWRRSFDVPPPGGESLKDTAARVLPYWDRVIRPVVLSGKRVLIAAHGNSLRSLIMRIENLTGDEIVKRELATGAPVIYWLNKDGSVARKQDLGA